MPNKKFTDLELKQLLRQRISCTEIASRLGVAKSTVSERLKALKIAVSKDITLRSAGEIVRNDWKPIRLAFLTRSLVDRKELDTAAQLQKINRHANEMLDLLMRWTRGDGEALQILATPASGGIGTGDGEGEKFGYRIKDPRELALKVMQEIRGQLKPQFEIFKAISDMQAVQQFQSEVLEIIGNVSPDARDEIIRRLTEKNALRSSLDLN